MNRESKKERKTVYGEDKEDSGGKGTLSSGGGRGIDFGP